MGKTSVTAFSFNSMTGFGEACSECALPNGKMLCLRVQCKSVNHRFIDISLKCPSVYSSFELAIQKKIRDCISRGRIEIQVAREELGSASTLQINADYIRSFIEEVSRLSVPGVEKEELLSSSLPSMWSRKDIFEPVSMDSGVSSEEEALLFSLLDSALSALSGSRAREGAVLGKEVALQLSLLEKCIDKIERLSQGESKEIKDKISQRVSELLDGYELQNDIRLLTEVALLADKADIREELVRAHAHIDHFKSIVKEGGRKLDFLLQEMVRECNTIASKTTLPEVSALVVDSKAILEKIKEQLQNVE